MTGGAVAGGSRSADLSLSARNGAREKSYRNRRYGWPTNYHYFLLVNASPLRKTIRILTNSPRISARSTKR
jgi:hypothetical protein